MNEMRKRCVVRTIVCLAIFGLFVAMFAACGDKEDATGGVRIEQDLSRPVAAGEAGATVLVVTGTAGTAWTAEILSGREWISFDPNAPGGRIVMSGVVGPDAAAGSLFVYYWPNRTGTERQALIRFSTAGGAISDATLTQPAAAAEGDLYESGRSLVWPEIPARLTADTDHVRVSDLTYVTHTALLGGAEVRNYTLCFDATKLGAWWVAYPLPEKGYTGDILRPKPDPWSFDPLIAAGCQADLSRGSYAGSYDRGHQIPNADRNGSREMQYQTFYCSNATPQVSSLNQGQWKALEEKVREWKCADTLYVVTGAVWQGSTTTTDKSGRQCPVPTYYFKVLLRTVAGSVRRPGDRIGDYPADRLRSVGFWVANTSGTGSYATWATTVAEIERKTGFTFFPTVPEAVKNQQPSLWPGL